MRKRIDPIWLARNISGALFLGSLCACNQLGDPIGDQAGGQNQNSNQDLVGSCPAGAVPDLGPGKQIVEQQCNSCHSFDVNQLGGNVFASIEAGSMPPNGPLSDGDMEQVRLLIACTTGGAGVTQGVDDEDGEDEDEDED